MKKTNFNVIVLSIILCITSCGPSAEEINKVRYDSISKADAIAATQAENQAKKEMTNGVGQNNQDLAKEISFFSFTPDDRKFIKTVYSKFKVVSVINATEKIEDLTKKYGGFIVFSDLKNSVNFSSHNDIRRDSILKLTEYVVNNEIKLRVPNARLDSFIRALNQIIVFLDSREINLNDVTIQYKANLKKAERLNVYNDRQIKHIDTKKSKLKETTPAEENVLEHQMQSDDLLYKNLDLEDKIKYCDLTFYIYQKPVVFKEVLPNIEYISSLKPNFFKRVWDSIVVGFWILEELVIALIKIWGIILMGFIVYKIIRLIINKINKK